jgi:hypothetical protein
MTRRDVRPDVPVTLIDLGASQGANSINVTRLGRTRGARTPGNTADLGSGGHTAGRILLPTPTPRHATRATATSED